MSLWETPLPNTLLRAPSSLLVALSLSLLTGCSTISIPPLQALKVMPDEACLQEAETLRPLTEKTLEALILKLAEVADEYHVLAARHRCLVEFSRR